MTKRALSVFAWFDKFPLIRALFILATRYIVESGLVHRKTKIDKGVKAEIQIMLSLGMTLSEGYSVL